MARLTASPAVPDDLPNGWRDLLIAMTAANPARRPTALQVAVACGELRAPTRTTAEQLRFLLTPQEEAGGHETTAPMDAAPRTTSPATAPSTEPLPLVAGAPAAPRPRRRAGATAAALAVLLAGAVGVGFAVGSSAPPPVIPDVGGSLGVHVGERFAAVEPIVEPAAPAAETSEGVEVTSRDTGEGASGDNPNRGPGNNSGSGADENSGKGNSGNGNSGNGNGNSGNGNGNSGKGKGSGG